MLSQTARERGCIASLTVGHLVSLFLREQNTFRTDTCPKQLWGKPAAEHQQGCVKISSGIQPILAQVFATCCCLGVTTWKRRCPFRWLRNWRCLDDCDIDSCFLDITSRGLLRGCLGNKWSRMTTDYHHSGRDKTVKRIGGWYSSKLSLSNVGMLWSLNTITEENFLKNKIHHLDGMLNCLVGIMSIEMLSGRVRWLPTTRRHRCWSRLC